MRGLSAGRRRLFAACLVLASTMLALAGGEVATRLLWSPASGPGPHRLPPELRGLPRLKGVFALGAPNQRGVYDGVLHETNSAGFRGREYSRAKPADVFRIVVIGDSITMGQGVRAEQTYSALLERKLNETRTDHRFEVLNLGIAGLNLTASVGGRLERVGFKFDPDLVVYGFTLNDIEGPSYRRTHRLGPTDRYNTGATSGSRLWDLVQTRWRYVHELVSPPPGSYVYELNDNYFNNPEAWQDFLTALDRLADIAIMHQMCGVVFIHTRMHALNLFHPYHRHYDLVASAARDRGLFVVESFEYFMGRDAHELWVGPWDPHPNAEGHRIFAEALLRGLEELPARCWTRRSGIPFLAPKMTSRDPAREPTAR